jgi:deoxyribonuclease-4
MALSFSFGTVGSPIGTPKKPGGSVGAIEFSKSVGLNTLELGWVRSIRVTEKTCAAIKQAGEEHEVDLSVHGSYFFNLNATDEEWPKSRQRLMDAAYYGNLAGATDIIFHPGSYFKQPPEEVLKVAIPRLKGVADELRKAKNPVTLRPETMGKSAMLGSLEDTLAMSKAIKNGPGDGSVNSVEEWTQIIEAYQAALGKESLKTLHIHLSGIEYGPKGEKKHLALGESDLKVLFLFEVLRDYGCAGRILCESPIMEADALNMKQAWIKVSGEKE